MWARAPSNRLLTHCTKAGPTRVVFACFLMKVEPLSGAAARNAFSFSEGCHALYVSGASSLCCCSICVLEEIRAMH